MDTKELQSLQKVVHLAFKALETLAKWPKKSPNPTVAKERTETAKALNSRKRRRPEKVTDETKHVKSRRIWVKQDNLSRDIDGLFVTTFCHAQDQQEFRKRTGMTLQVFDMLFSLVGEQLNKNSIRTPIAPDCRLFLTLVYLSNAECVQDLSKVFKMGSSTVRGIIKETSEVLWNTLAPAFMPYPNLEDWLNIAEGYQKSWQIAHCLGAVDARLLEVAYKGEHDIVILVSCDTNLCFNRLDIATVTDPVQNQLNWQLDFASQLLTQQLDHILTPEALENEQHKSAYAFIANETFPMRNQLLVPYKKRQPVEDQLHFNRHLSRTLAGTIDKAFNLLVSRWRVLSQPLRQSPSNAEKIIKAAVVLHNFVKLHDETYCPDNYLEQLDRYPIKNKVPSSWLSCAQQPQSKCNATIQLRDSLKRTITIQGNNLIDLKTSKGSLSSPR